MKPLLFISAALLAFPAWACPGIEITNGWIRQAPPGAHVMAAYAQIHNSTSKNRNITQISSKRFGAIEAHQTVMKNGESRMLALDALEIPAHGETRLEPGGIHLMLFRPQQPQLQPGDKTVLSFRCGKSKAINAEFIVKPAP